jgi:hypothetical protein
MECWSDGKRKRGKGVGRSRAMIGCNLSLGGGPGKAETIQDSGNRISRPGALAAPERTLGAMRVIRGMTLFRRVGPLRASRATCPQWKTG